jgi:hypothetical protein
MQRSGLNVLPRNWALRARINPRALISAAAAVRIDIFLQQTQYKNN